MNELEYYDRHSEPWEKSELNQLKKEYVGEKMSIIKIAIIHSRTPGSISSKLKSLGIITNITLARGYLEYLNSDLYNEIQRKVEDTKKVATPKPEIEQREYTKTIYGLTKSKSVANPEIFKTPLTKGIYGLDKSKYPSRMGQAWAEDEVVQLLKLVHAKKSVQEIAVIHQRTEGGIIAKLKVLAVDYYIYDKRSIHQIEKFTGLSKDTILKEIAKRQLGHDLRNDTTKSPVKTEPPIATGSVGSDEPKLKEILTVMKDIQHTMKIILEKIQ
jgi:hypothetical protein